MPEEVSGSLELLKDKISDYFVDIILDYLKKEEIDSPIIRLHLAYLKVQTYIPYVYFATENELEETMSGWGYEAGTHFLGPIWMTNI